jgi:hypothetical protein
VADSACCNRLLDGAVTLPQCQRALVGMHNRGDIALCLITRITFGYLYCSNHSVQHLQYLGLVLAKLASIQRPHCSKQTCTSPPQNNSFHSLVPFFDSKWSDAIKPPTLNLVKLVIYVLTSEGVPLDISVTASDKWTLLRHELGVRLGERQGATPQPAIIFILGNVSTVNGFQERFVAWRVT